MDEFERVGAPDGKPTDVVGKRKGGRGLAAPTALLLLPALMVELLFGSTHLTIITALIPEVGFYGGAALIIRYVVALVLLAALALRVGRRLGTLSEHPIPPGSGSQVAGEDGHSQRK